MANDADNKVLTDKIKGFISERIKKPVKEGVDFTAIIKKLKDRRAKKSGNSSKN